MDILTNIDKNEIINENAKINTKSNIKNGFLTNLIYVILWIAFDAFFVYLMTLQTVKQEFWLVLIPVCGFNLLVVWTYVFNVLKAGVDCKDTGYILTDKAFYYYSNNKHLSNEELNTLNTIWNSFNRDEISSKTIVVRDGSGSMYDYCPVSANCVATSLALLFAERLQGEKPYVPSKKS